MARWQTILAAVVLLTARARCGPASAASLQPAPPLSHADNLVGGGGGYGDCLSKDSSAPCLKYKLFSLVDRVLLGKDSLRLSEGVTVLRTAPAAAPGDGAPRSLAEEVHSRGLDEMLASRLDSFLNSHSLQLDLKGSDVLGAISSVGRAFGQELEEDSEDNSVGEERGKKKKVQKILLPLLLALKLKAAALIPLALGAIALIAGKALLVGKIALVLASIIGLKKLLSQQQKMVTYEVVSHPHHVSSLEGGGHGFSSSDVGSYGSSGGGGGGGGGHGGWGRSADAAASTQEDAHGMAYRAYVPQS